MIVLIRYLSVLFLSTVFSCSDQAPSANNENIELKGLWPLAISDPSGLSLHPDGESIWVVSDNPGRPVYRIDLRGNRIGTIPFDGEDLEGIAWDARDNTLWLVEERRREVIHMDTTGRILKRKELEIVQQVENDGLEGIAVNPANGHIFVINEKNPRIFIELTPELDIIKITPVDFEGKNTVTDISGLFFDPDSSEIWILSDESQKIVITDAELNPLRSFDLLVDKAEGLTVDTHRRLIYVVSDSESILYVYAY
ncbi:MAG: SdiA-regulated domain-containing protein [Cyclonatronaceae bacterium]